MPFHCTQLKVPLLWCHWTMTHMKQMNQMHSIVSEDHCCMEMLKTDGSIRVLLFVLAQTEELDSMRSTRGEYSSLK